MWAVSKPASSMARPTASAIADEVISSGSGGPPAWPGRVGASTSCLRSSAGSTSSHERHVSVKPWISTSGGPEPPRWSDVKTLPSGGRTLVNPAPACEILGGHVVEEVLELLDDFLGVLDLVLELDGRLLDHGLGGEDRGARAHGQRERVGRARVDLDLAAVQLQRDRRVEGVLLQLRDRHLAAGHLELAEHVVDQVVRHGARRGGALELHQDRCRLRMSDPDRQELVAVASLQKHDRLLADHVEAHSVNDHLEHRLEAPSQNPAGLPDSLDTPHRGYAAPPWRVSCEWRSAPTGCLTRRPSRWQRCAPRCLPGRWRWSRAASRKPRWKPTGAPSRRPFWRSPG